MESWYALRSNAHKEAVLYDQVQARKINCFFPRVEVDPVNPRSRKWRAFFPNYLFVNTDLEQTGESTFNQMPFSQGLVRFGGVPAKVPVAIIEKVRSVVDTVNQNVKQGEVIGFTEGENVRVVDGPFKGYEGIFDASAGGDYRVIVLLELLNRGGFRRVAMDATQIRKA